MEMNKIEKVVEHYSKIKRYLDDVKQLENLAESIIKSNTGFSFTIKYFPPKEDDMKPVLNSRGDLMVPGGDNPIEGFVGMIMLGDLSQMMSDPSMKFGGTERNPPHLPNNNKTEISLELNDVLSLEIIGVLIREKKKIIDVFSKQVETLLKPSRAKKL